MNLCKTPHFISDLDALRLTRYLFLVVAFFICLALSPHTFAAITGTGDCSGIANPQTSDFTCTGDLTIDGASTLTLQGDITLTVNGTLTVTGAGSILKADAANTFVAIVATTLTVDSGAYIDANGLGCPKSQSFNTATDSGCIDNGIPPTSGFGEGGNDPDSTTGGGGGAGYGGTGGAGHNGGAGGDSYGEMALTTLMLGSGGGGGYAQNNGGAGGGAVKLVR